MSWVIAWGVVDVVLLCAFAWLVQRSKPKQLDVYPEPLATGRPATRIGRYVIFPGGHTVRLSRWQHLLFALGVKESMSNTRTRKES